MIHDSILDCIGKTPIVRLNKIPIEEEIQCELFAKCEYFNAGGSIKDRIAKRMIEAAEFNGLLKPGYTIIEPTSGNTGIGLALAGALKGYKVIITMPEKMSQEKFNLLKALGAQVIRTPSNASSDSPNSHISVARRLNQEIPNSIILDQYSNPNNPLAHYFGTAEEIIEDCGDHLDMIVIGAGTGGTISGVAKRLKEKYRNIIVIGVDPIGSILSNASKLDQITALYQVEGIGYDFIPKVLDQSLIDSWGVTNDDDSFHMAKRLIKSEGLLCGGSSGSIAWAAIQAIKAYKFDSDPSKRVLIILPDSVRNYMSKFVNPDWMFKNQFMNHLELFKEYEFNNESFKFDHLNIKLSSVMTLNSNESISSVLNSLKDSDFPQKYPVVFDFSTKTIIGNFGANKLFQMILKNGRKEVKSMDLSRFINKDFNLWKTSDNIEILLASFAVNIPSYLVDGEGRAITDQEGRVQLINPFSLLQ